MKDAKPTFKNLVFVAALLAVAPACDRTVQAGGTTGTTGTSGSTSSTGQNGPTSSDTGSSGTSSTDGSSTSGTSGTDGTSSSSGTTGSSSSTSGTTSTGTSGTLGTSGTTGTNGTGGTTGTTAGAICSSCNTASDCASGYCDTNRHQCNVRDICSQSECQTYGLSCGSDGNCICSTGSTTGTTGTSGTSGTTSTNGTTGTTGVSNDLCSSPAPIADGQTVTGDTTHATNDYDPGSGGCTRYTENGPDVVYSFTPSASGSYTFTLTPGSSTYDAAIYLLSSCPASGASITSCVGGSDHGSGGAAETLTLQLTAGTTYFIIVDGYSGSSGSFTLGVQGGTCTAGGSCTPSNPCDVGTISCTTGQPVCNNTGTPAPDGTGCGSGQICHQGACQSGCLINSLYYASSAANPSNACQSCAPATSTTAWTNVKDGTTCGAGAVCTQGACATTSCPSATAIQLGQTAHGDTSTSANNYDPTSGGCTGFAEMGPDLVFAFTPGTTGQYAITLSPTASTYNAALYVLNGCPTPGAPVGSCLAGSDKAQNGGAESLSLTLNAGSTYYIIVDGYNGTSGTFNLSVLNANGFTAGTTTVTTLAGNGVAGFADGTGGPNGTAEFGSPGAIAADASGSIYVTDSDGTNGKIRQIDSNGNTITFYQDPAASGYSPIIVDLNSNVYAAEENSFGQRYIIKLNSSGGYLGTVPTGMSQNDPGIISMSIVSGNLFGLLFGEEAVYSIGPSSLGILSGSPQISSFADGPSGTARFNTPWGVVYDTSRNVFYVADSVNNRIRIVDLRGTATTLAGNGTAGFADGTGGPNGTAEFSYPVGVAADGLGNVYVADSTNGRIRKIDASGNVTTIAGNGMVGHADGTGGPDGTAEFQYPRYLAVDASGNVIVPDPMNHRIRSIHIQ